MISETSGEWLTYADAGTRLGISAQAVRHLARRRGWVRRTPNAYGVRAQVLVPLDALEQPRTTSDGVQMASMAGAERPFMNGHEQPDGRVFEVLREQLAGLTADKLELNRRLDRAEDERRELLAALRAAQDQVQRLLSEKEADQRPARRRWWRWGSR